MGIRMHSQQDQIARRPEIACHFCDVHVLLPLLLLAGSAGPYQASRGGARGGWEDIWMACLLWKCLPSSPLFSERS